MVGLGSGQFFTFNEIVPGHAHLDRIAGAVKAGVRMAGGTPLAFNTIGVCDGIAMGHPGMHCSLPTRELVADTVEMMVTAHRFDGLVFVPNCGKIVPGMLNLLCLATGSDDPAGASWENYFPGNTLRLQERTFLLC